ncbi:MATE family efflux transporter [Bradyrhizobium embrapense]|uniref:MATE family efflux transporter n=1 Tax=Bradyrhizobium embrapense TaxID=630921 RepID=UPI00067A80DF|nr:MATE family efflux transporter [Bradyrhizobium embrapense]
MAGHDLAVELSETAKLALPMVLTHLGQVAMMTTDLAFIGRISAEALAAAALATRVYLVSFTFGVGLLVAIAPLVAQAFGADNLAVARRSLRAGLWAALMLSFPIMAFALSGERILLALGQAPNAARLAQQYLFGLVWGVLPALGFQAFRNFMGAVNRPEPVLLITIAGMPVNALLVCLLIYGKLGLPRLDLFGAGLATTLVNCGMFLAVLWFAIVHRSFREYHLLARLWRVDWPLMRQLIVIGAPTAIASLLGYGLFSAAALLAGLIDTNALAAHQIAHQVDVILVMILFGISMAATVRVGHAVGRNDGRGVKRTGLVAMLIGVAIAAILTLIVIVARFAVARLFLGEPTGDAKTTTALAAKLLLVGSSFFVTQAVQSIGEGVLRGMKDTRVPLVCSGVFCLIGFSLSYLLGLKLGLGAIGIWIGLSIGTTVYAGLLVMRFQLLANRLTRAQATRTTP